MELKEVNLNGDDSSVVVKPSNDRGVFAKPSVRGLIALLGDRLDIVPITQATAEHIVTTGSLSALDVYVDEPTPGFFRGINGARIIIWDSMDPNWRNEINSEDSVIELNPPVNRQFSPVEVVEAA